MIVIAWLLVSHAIIIGSAERVNAGHAKMHDQLYAEEVTQVQDQLHIEEAVDGEAELLTEAHGEAELSRDVTETEDFSVACYCKTVDGQDQCIDNKYLGMPYKPSGPRYYHEGVQGKKDGEVKNICCKTDYSSLFSFVGFSYSKSPDKYCESETLNVPETSCCVLKDEHGSFGVRVSKVQSLAINKKPGTEYGRYAKSPPFFDLNDITRGEDFTGAQVPLQDVRAFITKHLDAGRFDNKLQCGGTSGTVDKLFANTESTCQLRTRSSRQCCCHIATLIETIRCLPAEGAANEEEATVKVLPSTVKIDTKHGYKQHVLSHQVAPNEGRMQSLISDTVDPEQEDLPDTEADETKMKWSWTKQADQWSYSCSKQETLPYVRSQTKSKRVANGRTCRTQRMGRYSKQVCHTKYKTVKYEVYSQGHTEKCVEYTWTRKCPAGQGLFEKVIQKGGCFTEHENLEDLGSLMYQCPKDYESGNGGTTKYNRLCKCEEQCA